MGEDRVPGHAANGRVERREQERKRSLRESVFERAVSRALSYQRAAWMAMPTKTSATITIKAATMMSIVITPSTTECGDQSTLWREYTKRTQCNPELVVRPQPRQSLTHGASTLTSFMRPAAPDLMDTAAFRHRKCSATKATSSSLALPSTGGDFTFASQVPSGACTREEARALGFTLICMSTVAISAYGLTACRRAVVWRVRWSDLLGHLTEKGSKR